MQQVGFLSSCTHNSSGQYDDTAGRTTQTLFVEKVVDFPAQTSTLIMKDFEPSAGWYTLQPSKKIQIANMTDIEYNVKFKTEQTTLQMK